MITAMEEFCVDRNDTASISGHSEKKPPRSGRPFILLIRSFRPATAMPFRPRTGSRIILIHRTALTAGIIKKGEISRTRTIPRPGKARLTNKAMAKPRTTVKIRIDPTMKMLLLTALTPNRSKRLKSKKRSEFQLNTLNAPKFKSKNLGLFQTRM